MPARKRKRRDPIPEGFPSLEAAGEFWDTHDLADYWDLTRPVKDYVCRIESEEYVLTLKPAVMRRLAKVARQRGISSEALANQWLGEKLKGEMRKPRRAATG
jgi:hypothetical protein